MIRRFRSIVLVAASVLAPVAGSGSALAGELPDHRVGMGLDGVNYFQSYAPFNDLAKTMRWVKAGGYNAVGLPTSAEDPGKPVIGRVGVSYGSTYPGGDYVLTWRGEGDVTLDRPGDAELNRRESTTDGLHRRVYRIQPNPGDYGFQLKIHSFPIDELHLYIPGGEDAEGLWNPAYLRVMEPFRGTHLRFMDLNETNHSQQERWSDRTPLDHASWVHPHRKDKPWPTVKGGVPYEAMIQLCNTMDTDMWVTVPHLADPAYMANLAHLIRTGIDRATGERTTEPLREDLRVWVEYSNEVWNWNFDQSDWVLENVPGDNLDESYARKAKELFTAFEAEFGGDERLVRVIATQTGYGNGRRSEQRLAFFENPAEEVDALAITTYFSLDIEQWIVDHWPVTVEQTLDELSRRVGEGKFAGDDSHDRHAMKVPHYELGERLGIPVVAYEGGPHLLPERPVFPAEVTDRTGKGSRKMKEKAPKLVPEILGFIQELERTPRFGEIYQQFLARHHASGLAVNTPFVLLANWRDSGQWGHVESLAQPLEEAHKYQAILDFYDLPEPPEEVGLAPEPK